MADYDRPYDADDYKRRSKFTIPKVIFTVFMFLLGIGLIAFGGDDTQIINALIDYQAEETARIDDPTTDIFADWATPSKTGETYMQIMLWNLTNPDEVLAGQKPHVNPVGPFSYYYRKYKHSFVYSSDRSIIYYKELAVYNYIDNPCPPGTAPDDFSLRCSLPESTVVTTPNAPLWGLLQTIAPLKGFEQDIIDLLESKIKDKGSETLLIRRNMSDIIFGYQDELLDEINEIIGNASSPLEYNIFENASKSDNNSYSAIKTRASEGDFGKVVAWEGHNFTVDYWNGCPEEDNDVYRLYNFLANMINGTFGDVFQPGIEKTDNIPLFINSLYRSGYAVYNNSYSFRDLNLYRFILRHDCLEGASENPLNCAFSDYGPQGTLNLTAAVGAPMFASKPWFLDASSDLGHNLTNYTPPPATQGENRRSLYDTFLDIEPYSGTLLRAHERLQTSLQVIPSSHVKAAKNLSYAFIPVMYADQNYELSEKDSSDLHESLKVILEVKSVFVYVGPIVGGVIVLLSLLSGFLLYKRRYRRIANTLERRALLGAGGDINAGPVS